MIGHIQNEPFRRLLLSYPEKAIELLYDYYYKRLVSIANRLTHDLSASEDIVQETFLHVWTNHKQLGQHHERSIEHYLVKVVRYKAISHFKQSLRIKMLATGLVNGHKFDSIESSAEVQIIKVELAEDIRRIVSSFPRREKECLLMKIDDEMTTEQIADKLKVTKKAVERSITSAKKRLSAHWLKKRE